MFRNKGITDEDQIIKMVVDEIDAKYYGDHPGRNRPSRANVLLGYQNMARKIIKEK